MGEMTSFGQVAGRYAPRSYEETSGVFVKCYIHSGCGLMCNVREVPNPRQFAEFLSRAEMPTDADTSADITRKRESHKALLGEMLLTWERENHAP